MGSGFLKKLSQGFLPLRPLNLESKVKVLFVSSSSILTTSLLCRSSPSLCTQSPSLSPHFLWNLNYCVLPEIFKDGNVLKEAYYQVLSSGFFFSFLSRYCTLLMRDAKQAWFSGQASRCITV